MATAPAARPDSSPSTSLRALLPSAAPSELAGERLVPVISPLAEVLGVSGLQRGSVVVLEPSLFPGTTALALALLAQATNEGMWCVAFGLRSLGLAAASELGLCFERLAIVPEARGREAMFLATLFEGCDIVVAALARPLSGLDARRLIARARERRGVLVVLGASGGSRRTRLWPEEGDLTMTVTGGRFVGLEEQGRISGHLVEVTSRRRRGGGTRRVGSLWLPGPDGQISAAPAMLATPNDSARIPVG
jgi:hypothetical protein